jgi:hypothetical protein
MCERKAIVRATGGVSMREVVAFEWISLDGVVQPPPTATKTPAAVSWK